MAATVAVLGLFAVLNLTGVVGGDGGGDAAAPTTTSETTSTTIPPPVAVEPSQSVQDRNRTIVSADEELTAMLGKLSPDAATPKN